MKSREAVYGEGRRERQRMWWWKGSCSSSEGAEVIEAAEAAEAEGERVWWAKHGWSAGMAWVRWTLSSLAYIIHESAGGSRCVQDHQGG